MWGEKRRARLASPPPRSIPFPSTGVLHTRMLWRTSYYVSWWCCMHYGNDTVWLAIPKISWTTSRPSTPKTLTMLFVLMSSIDQSIATGFCAKASHSDQSEQPLQWSPSSFQNNRQRFPFDCWFERALCSSVSLKCFPGQLTCKVPPVEACFP